MSVVAMAKPKTASERRTGTVVDTIIVTPESVAKWKSPVFQRPVRENDKVLALAESLKENGGVWPGIVTLGIFEGATFIVDGQHRKQAFLISGLREGYTDIRMHYFGSMAEMGEEFVQLNSQLVRMRPDDMLRGLEDSSPALQQIRSRCPFVGYDMIRRGEKSPILSMASALRWWKGASFEVPTANANAMSTTHLATTTTVEEADMLCDFLQIALSAFGRDQGAQRLWGGLNMILCMWIHRHMVLTSWGPKKLRISKENFKKCMMSLAADVDYCDWLLGRIMGDRDRSPAYHRVKTLFTHRLFSETGQRAMMPQPAWDSQGRN